MATMGRVMPIPGRSEFMFHSRHCPMPARGITDGLSQQDLRTTIKVNDEMGCFQKPVNYDDGTPTALLV